MVLVALAKPGVVAVAMMRAADRGANMVCANMATREAGMVVARAVVAAEMRWAEAMVTATMALKASVEPLEAMMVTLPKVE